MSHERPFLGLTPREWREALKISPLHVILWTFYLFLLLSIFSTGD